MQFDEADSPHLKDWIIKRLENISDADSDVLADYVLALIKSDEPEDQVRANCTENLEDFLGEHTQGVVQDLFTTLDARSFVPGYVPPQKLSATAPSFQPPTGPASAPSHPSVDQSRKRAFNDREGSESRDNHYGRGQNGERAIKQSRRGGPGARGGRGGPNGGYSGYQPHQQNVPAMPTPPPGFPPLDPNNPMAAIMAMQAMGFPSLPGFPGLPGSPSPAGLRPSLTPSSRKRCRDYDTKGYCAAGSMCPYEHGNDHIVLPGGPEEYDPKNADLSEAGVYDGSRPARGAGRSRGRGRGGRGDFNTGGRGGRAAFSSAGPNSDRNITSIVVEQIPEEKFSEESVREFFSEFGSIEDVNMQAYKRLAVVKYADFNSAKSAYESPKVIFDNRFVKVYWYKPEAVKGETAAAMNGRRAEHDHAPDDAEMVDPEEFAQRQAQAQQAYEEKARKIKEAEAQKEELQQKIQAQAEERKKLMEKLAAKTAGKAGTPTTGSPAPSGANGGAPKANAKMSQTDALRAKLAELEVEAETIGLPSEEAASAHYNASSYRGRGAYNPHRGSFRGRGGPGFRGGWRGGATAPGGGVARLDNRPRSVEVKASDGSVDFGDDKLGEALRVCLFGIGEFSAITPTSKPSAIGTSSSDQVSVDNNRKPFAIVSFNARYVAEMFIDNIKRSGSTISGIGKVELSWVANDVAKAAAEAAGTLSIADKEQNKDAGMNDATDGAEHGHAQQHDTVTTEMDYDVADDDDDRWMR